MGIERPTDEQRDIVACPGKVLAINAFAGTGKTSTLDSYAAARPTKRMLYLAFNKAIQAEAQRKFPSNVECRTTHSIAYRAVGHRYRDKLAPDIRPLEISVAFGLRPADAYRVVATVKHFMASADPEISALHLDPVDAAKLDPDHLSNILSRARQLWDAMLDPGNQSVKMLHDGYLKLYQLSSPRLYGYDTVLFDEAQDANPTILDVVLNQSCGKVFVGDTHQNIYSFRGSVDAMSMIDADHVLSLTRSFRFGGGIAHVASLLLSHWKGERRQIIGQGNHPTTFSVDRNKRHTFIARTNAGLFDQAVACLGQPMHFVGGVLGYNFDRIVDAWRLYANRKGEIVDPYYRRFESFDQMREYGEETEDPEITILVRIILKYRNDIPTLVSQIKRSHLDNMDAAHCLLTNAHKSKGLEFDQVVLLDDFVDFFGEGGLRKPIEIKAEDINLLYVAITRAERAIDLNARTVRWLERALPN